MASDRAGGLKRTSCVIVLIGQNRLVGKRIASVLRAAGFRTATSVPDADLAFLRAAAGEHQTISIFEVNNRLEKTSHHFEYFGTLYPTGWFRDTEAAKEGYLTPKNRYLTPKKGRRFARAGKGADEISEDTASSRAMTPAAAVGERDPTDRQAMILKSLVNGDTNKVVARKLHIAEETVKVHMKRLLRRIGVKNRTQAAIWALSNYFAPAPSQTGNLQRGRSFTEPRSTRRSATPKAVGAASGPQVSPLRGGKAKGRGKTIRKSNIAKYH
jgi:DNA-binding CsgD family transcriptional regulator